MSAMIRRTIKPAEVNSRISAEAATAAARVVYRDRATGRFVILENEHAFHPRSQKRGAKRANSRSVAAHSKGSAGHSAPERGSAKKQ
jgi:hypothetical protein